jgi:hypothetical protein
MAMHLIKLCVGCDNISDLAAWQATQAELVHVTRQTPKQAEALLDGGSLYWVINGWLCARQRLLALRPLSRGGVPHCGLVLDRALVRVQPRKHRPFQGWRYLQPTDAPPDLDHTPTDPASEAMLRELSVLGLL